MVRISEEFQSVPPLVACQIQSRIMCAFLTIGEAFWTIHVLMRIGLIGLIYGRCLHAWFSKMPVAPLYPLTFVNWSNYFLIESRVQPCNPSERISLPRFTELCLWNLDCPSVMMLALYIYRLKKRFAKSSAVGILVSLWQVLVPSLQQLIEDRARKWIKLRPSSHIPIIIIIIIIVTKMKKLNGLQL